MNKAFLLDENFPTSARTFLEDEQCTVLDIRGTALEGCDDKTLFAFAQKNSAILLTTDKDFFHTIPMQFPQHQGVVVIALKRPNGTAIIQRLKENWMHLKHQGFENQVILLTDVRIYSRRNRIL